MSSRICVAALLVLAAACSKPGEAGKGGGGGGPRAAMAFPVEVAPVELEPMLYTLAAVGSVEAFETVQVTARVSGVVERVRFRDGDMVKKDEVLVEIEPERFRLAVDAARAMLEKAQASASDAKASLDRREAVSAKNPGLIRGEEVETYRMRVRTAEAEIFAAKTALAQAELNLRDALVRSPIPGRVQTRTVQTGQFVQPGTVLATMVRRDPLLLRFKVPERDAEPLETGQEVTFRTPGEAHEHRAKITLVSEMADPQSRMVAVTAEVTGEDSARVKPGAFAEVTIAPGAARTVPVIPQTAIRPSERGFLAYVVEGDVAKSRVVQLGMRSPAGGVEVKSGLSAGELLVVRGSEALRDGVKVRIAEEPKGSTGEQPKRGGGGGTAP